MTDFDQENFDSVNAALYYKTLILLFKTMMF